MKRPLYLLLVLSFMFSCSSSENDSNDMEEAVVKDEKKFTYSSSYEIADYSNQQIVRDWISALAAGDMETVSGLFADSVSVYLANGDYYHSTKDSITSLAQGFVSSNAKIEITHLAALVVNSTDMDATWSIIWIDELLTKDDGTTERNILHEAFLIEDGKIRSIRQYKQKPSESEGPAEVADDAAEYAYSGSFIMADEKLIEVVTGWNEAIAGEADFEKAATYLADSVTVYFEDGTSINSTKDSLMVAVKEFITNVNGLKVVFNAAMAVHSTDRDETWVLSWTDESWTGEDGKTVRMLIHEDYLIVDNKIRLVRQYGMQVLE